MASTEPDRSLSSGISLPQWMKSKMGDRYDMQEAAAFSPPSQDDTFFYIRYPRPGWGSAGPDQGQGPYYRPITEVLEEPGAGHRLTSEVKDGSTVPQPKQPPAEVDPNCTKSVVDVAQLMISARFSAVRGLNPDDCAPATSEGFDFSRRRGSKSLPSSPLHSPETSPRTPRRSRQNRYFTNAFVPAPQETQVEPVRPSGGWILASFLSQTRDRELISSQDLLRADAAVVGEQRQEGTDLHRNKSSSCLPLGPIGEEEVGAAVPGRLSTFQAKPSELREMNFWSPTSM